MASAASDSFRCAAILSSILARAASTALRAATTSSAALAAADLVALMSSMPLVTVALARAMSVSYCGCVLGMDWGEHDACQRVGLLEGDSTGHHEGLFCWKDRRDLPEGGRGWVRVTSYRLDPDVECAERGLGRGHRRLGLVNFVRGGGVVRTGSLIGRGCWGVVSRWQEGARRSSVGEEDEYRTGHAPPRYRRRCIEAT